MDFAAERADLVVEFSLPARKRSEMEPEPAAIEMPKDLHRAHFRAAPVEASQHVEYFDRLGHFESICWGPSKKSCRSYARQSVVATLARAWLPGVSLS